MFRGALPKNERSFLLFGSLPENKGFVVATRLNGDGNLAAPKGVYDVLKQKDDGTYYDELGDRSSQGSLWV